jgi:hypothetical protein
LSISDIRCSGLPVRPGWGGTLKPYVVLEMGNSTFKTAVKKGEINPVFDFSKSIIVKDARQAMLSVKVLMYVHSMLRGMNSIHVAGYG